MAPIDERAQLDAVPISSGSAAARTRLRAARRRSEALHQAPLDGPRLDDGAVALQLAKGGSERAGDSTALRLAAAKGLEGLLALDRVLWAAKRWSRKRTSIA